MDAHIAALPEALDLMSSPILLITQIPAGA